MGGKGSGRKPLPVELRKFAFEPKQPIATDMFLPNLSGLARHREAQNLGGTTYTGTAPIDVTGTVISHDAGTETTATTYREMETDSTGHITNANIRSTVNSGTTLPSTPVEGELFLMDTIGRSVLYMYAESTWRPIHNYGAATMYVDGGSGVDSEEKGTAGGIKAFATVQYAIDQIGRTFDGNITIYVAAGTYSETVVVAGKRPVGNVKIDIIGTLTLQETMTSATVTAGTGATQGTFTKTGAFTGDTYSNLLAYFVTDDEYRIIDSHTNDTATVVGVCPSSTTQDVKIYSWATTVTQWQFRNLTMNFDLYFLQVSRARMLKRSQVIFNQCTFTGATGTTDVVQLRLGSSINLNYCYMEKDVATLTNGLIFSEGQSNTLITACKLYGGTTGAHIGINLIESSICILRYGSIVDNFDSTSGAIAVKDGSYLSTESLSTNGYNRIRNNVTGILASLAGVATGTTNNQYSGNTTNESPTGASDPAYID